MYKKILIANRGEIASRIIRACKSLSIQSVAIFSEADKDAPYVKEADEAVFIGESRVDLSYLNINKIIDVAKEFEVDAIHPGYGFLSENAEFAQACEKNNIVFIGPTALHIKQMSSKIVARQLMEKAGVPIVPGTNEAVDTLEEALNSASEIGYPVMLKASAGGGGVGLQIVNDSEELTKVFENNKKRAEQFFKDGSMFIEKVIKNARHIEVQVVCDGFGNKIHLFERECSIQRRNQKVIEEAPSSYISTSLRNQLGNYAIRAVNEIDYLNVGTVEFLVDQNDQVYFLEMNTRIQVEHPITEEITGFDLVEAQIKIANNQPIDIQQEKLTIDGHAIEARIYAEDPNTFFPSPGKITALELPNEAYIRHELTISNGFLVTPFYDPMIAKLIVKGSDRDEAISRLINALKNYKIEGIKTNIPMLLAILQHDAFKSGHTTTDFVDIYYLSKNNTTN